MLLGNAQEDPVTVLRIRTFLDLLDPDPDPLVRGMDPEKSKKNLDSYYFVTSF
jgi:hypothetical protein